ncbi:MAG: M48 family metallopeptidase [Endomicrobium sp.]|jgi:STE24 endopeptidase|nr:M48 family metallopeptidase [Endomicrobium sp.]
MNYFTCLPLSFIAAVYTIKTISDLLNIKNISNIIPHEFENFFDKKKYTKAQSYLKYNTKFAIFSYTFSMILQITFILAGGFSYVDSLASSFGTGTVLTGLIFAGILYLIYEIVNLPFSAYSTFVIEEKFGFNKMNGKIFVTDFIKSFIIKGIIYSVMFSVVVWLFSSVEHYAWLYAFAAITAFELFVTFIYPIAIIPLFNKYTPLEDGELKKSVEEYAKKENFKMKGLFKMDNSKRSTKSNAFFAGFGKSIRIVLFDTLIQKHTVEELTSVLAHEMGHFKLGHIVKQIFFSFVSTAIMLFVLSVFIKKLWIYKAFLMDTQPIYAGVIFFTFLYAPMSFVLTTISNYLSRKYEHEADIYSVTTYKHHQDMINALKKLSVDNLSNLTPHKLKVFLEYSHPPVLDRVNTIKNISEK